MKVGNAFLHLYQLDPSLLGHEIVVASTNNKAVENVSREIPGLEAVEDQGGRPRYFASVADRLAGKEVADESGTEEAMHCWGLAAAVLGNKANVREFVDGFWWHPEWSMRQYLLGVANGWTPPPPNRPGSEDEEDLPPAVLIRENAPLDATEALRRWRRTRKQFRITPFRLCMNQLRGRLRPVIDGVPAGPPAWPWVNDGVDTIHGFQGREADTVVLVLGAPGPEARGARAWAGGTPNLLNVAVSRAKRRLYVIGSHSAWKGAGVFRHLAAALPRKSWG